MDNSTKHSFATTTSRRLMLDIKRQQTAMKSPLPRDIISTLPSEIIALIITQLAPNPSSSQKDNSDEYPDEDPSDDDLPRAEADVLSRSREAAAEQRQREGAQGQHRRALHRLTRVRPFMREAERALWMAYAPSALYYAVCANDKRLADRCFSTVKLARLKLGRKFAHGVRLNRGTILHVAVMAGNAHAVRLLLSHGADIEARGHFVSRPPYTIYTDLSWNTKITPLGLSLVLGRARVSKLLLDRGASHEVGFPALRPLVPGAVMGFQALHSASMGSDRKALARLLQTPSIGLDDMSQSNLTPLHWALFHVIRVDHLQMLLEAGANPIMNPNVAEPLLHFLVQFRATKEDLGAAINLLVRHGVDINARNADNHTALVGAVRETNLPCVQALVENGADVNDVVKEDSPLWWCLAIHRADNSGVYSTKRLTRETVAIVELLLKHGLDEDPQALFLGILMANIGDDAKGLLMRLASRFTFSPAWLSLTFTRVGCQPSFYTNRGLFFLMDHFVPTDDSTLDECNLFTGLMGTQAASHPNFHRVMGPSFDVNAPLKGPNWDAELAVPPIVALTGSENYYHDTSRHTLEALLRRGANPQATNELGQNCLLAYITSHIRSRSLVFEKSDADINGSLCALVHMLAEHGFDFTSADIQGNTALHLIGMARWADRHVSCVDLLIQLGASASQRNNEGLTPIDVYIGAMQRQFMYIDGSFGRALAATLPDEERRHADGRLAGVMTMVRKKQRIKRNSIEHNR
ncbi:Ankyrin repeat-containing domain protein [Purpureocillium lilacinum]|uniref:Ankyrin repeat-containing domain protein n=2 Tax=Purpureocillium lilacinum TaxID=33203 RepID=A0A2U3ECF7_PURLI|nr:Ankyrin repeat-containing domain protein [Purpureocillium lilacinum]